MPAELQSRSEEKALRLRLGGGVAGGGGGERRRTSARRRRGPARGCARLASGAGSKCTDPARLALACQARERHRLGREIVDEPRRPSVSLARARRGRAASPGPSRHDLQRNRRQRDSVDRDDRRFRALDADLHDARVVEVEQAQPAVAGRRQRDLRIRLAVGAADRAERARLAGALRREERKELSARLVDPPVAQHDRQLGVIGLALVALDDEHAGQPASELLGRVAMRMEEEGAGVRRHEAVGETLAGPDRLLREIGHAVLVVRQADAVPVDRTCARHRAAGGSRASLRDARRASAARPAGRCRRRRSRAAASRRRKQGSASAARRRRGQVTLRFRFRARRAAAARRHETGANTGDSAPSAHPARPVRTGDGSGRTSALTWRSAPHFPHPEAFRGAEPRGTHKRVFRALSGAFFEAIPTESESDLRMD